MKRIREVFRCDCDGVSHKRMGGFSPVDNYPAARNAQSYAENTLSNCEEAARCTPPMCPWRSFEEPIVYEVLRAYRDCSGAMGGVQPALLLAKNPPRYLLDGLRWYCATLDKISDYDESKKPKDK